MFEFTLKEIASAVGGEILQGKPEQSYRSVSTDTRKIQPGCLFIALQGERFDAHDFCTEAVSQGAGGLLVSRRLSDLEDQQIPVILVKDTLKALQALARHNRRTAGIPVIAVTGSVGKTSTKDMLAAVLAQKYQVHKTGGNYNNEIGLPLTLLDLVPEHQVAVVEMGMRAQGEIRDLAWIAEPNIGVITNIGETHIEILGSVANIAAAKGELITALPATATVVLNGDDSWLRSLGATFTGKVLYYGFGEANQLRALDWQTVGAEGCQFTLEIQGSGNQTPSSWSVQLPVWGRHNVQNALAAAGVGLELGLSPQEICNGLAQVKLSAMRLQVSTAQPWVVINDAYNANPASTCAALTVLGAYPCTGKRLAVLGNMLELGAEAERGHRSVGAAAAELGVDTLVTLGDLAGWIAEEALRQGMAPAQVTAYQDKALVVEFLKKILQPGDVLLVKGSRGMKMEEIITQLG